MDLSRYRQNFNKKDSAELLELAARYRRVALEVCHEETRALYLAVAALAEEMTDPAAETPLRYPFEFIPPESGSTDLGVSNPPAPPIIEELIPLFVSVYADIALAMLGRKDANLQFAFVIWSLREKKTYADREAVIHRMQKATGKHRKTVQRWLQAGEGLFWTEDKQGRLWWHRCERVVDALGVAKPGRKLAIRSADLLNGLQRMRTALFNCRFNGKESQWASRQTLEELTGVEERTQRNYKRHTEAKIMPVFTLGPYRVEDSGEVLAVRQLPNRYFGPYEAHHKSEKQPERRHGIRTVENNGAVEAGFADNVSRKPERLLFDQPSAAQDAAYIRGKKTFGEVFAVVNPTQKSIICKTISHGIS